MERTGKMILSAVFGALIGLIIALSVNRLLWWIGLVAGGLTGYLSYEWRTVVKMAGELVGSSKKSALIGKKLVASLTLLCWMGGWVAVIAYPIIYVECMPTAAFFLKLSAAIAALCGICILFFAMMIIYLIIISNGSDFNDIKEEGKYIFFSSSLVALGVVLPYGLYLLARKLPMAGRAIGRFAWRLLILIHSEDRLIVGFSTLIGTAGGYIYKSFIVGAAAAAASVVLLKHVVADRWLKSYLSHS